jgi:hypothetical protein
LVDIDAEAGDEDYSPSGAVETQRAFLDEMRRNEAKGGGSQQMQGTWAET